MQQLLACSAGKRTYTFLMGKPGPAKLANFPEVEVFVLVADPEGLVLDSREYYAPLITPWEAHLAFTPGASWTASYRTDFNCLLVRRAAATALTAKPFILRRVGQATCCFEERISSVPRRSKINSKANVKSESNVLHCSTVWLAASSQTGVLHLCIVSL